MTPASRALARSRCCRIASPPACSAPRIDAEQRLRIESVQLVDRCRHGARDAPGAARQRDQIGQIVFALGILGGEPADQVEQQRTIHSHDSAIAQRNRQLLGRRFGRLDDFQQIACLVLDQPAIGILRLDRDAEHRHRRPAPPPVVEQALQRLRRDQRRVAIDDQNVVERGIGQRRARRRDGMAGTELLGLQHGRIGFRHGLDRGHVRADHDDDPRGVERLACVEHMAQHRLPGQPVHDFRDVGTHPRALARGKNDDCEAVSGHGTLPKGSRIRRAHRLGGERFAPAAALSPNTFCD